MRASSTERMEVRPMRWLGRAVLLQVVVLVVAAAAYAGTLDRVVQRGRLVCGVNGGLPGFGYLEPDGTWSGFDVDYCRAIAAAVLGDPDAVEFVALTAAQRLPALQTGEVDVLLRNTTFTLLRDTDNRLNFAPPIFYDGQGFMVHRATGVVELEDLAGASICVQTGTTTELNLADAMRAHGIPYTPVVFEEIDTTYNAYEQGRCDAVTSDRSQLAARRSVLRNPDDHVILEATISKEPLAPVVAHGDDQWYDIVKWVVYATFFAEEIEITSGNVDAWMTTDNPEVRRLLGLEGGMGRALGLRDDWAVQVIKGVGNYGEIYDRNLTPLGLPRGLNRPYTQGGLLYAMPFR
ncbi:amino acid ABC transporter substrate-binding protein [Geochorda subterranea]|uniref:Amino acid ABC transporter substrate-binding protein n=2 Tax=Geochorda subterranea TaxID=3109564 RepID=A0ABZ1BPG0_9FIRM|nr:amino acid ABC transporter substrate-binding protein [Limnochorda sp. LNt]WRP14498.1 amino acid ABC transporter substrate-binding protein [Limnochorda sp. LNt]